MQVPVAPWTQRLAQAVEAIGILGLRLLRVLGFRVRLDVLEGLRVWGVLKEIWFGEFGIWIRCFGLGS